MGLGVIAKMRLIIFYSISCIKDAGCRPNYVRVRPMSFMKGRTNIKRIIHARWSFNVPTKLYELFNPVNCYSYSKCYQYSAQNWIAGSKRIYSCNNAKNSKEMPPNKLQHFLCFEPKLLPTMSHLVLLPWNQNITTATKHPLSIISKDRTLSFHEWPTFEGGQIHEFS